MSERHYQLAKWLREAHKDGKLSATYTLVEVTELFLSDYKDIALKAQTL